jgi:hypothetical protein
MIKKIIKEGYWDTEIWKALNVLKTAGMVEIANCINTKDKEDRDMDKLFFNGIIKRIK